MNAGRADAFLTKLSCMKYRPELLTKLLVCRVWSRTSFILVQTSLRLLVMLTITTSQTTISTKAMQLSQKVDR